MTEREKQILDIIKANPAVEQSEIASRLKIARSSVAVHIANLRKKGLILGKGYIVPNNAYIVGLGAANVDVHGKSRAAVVIHDSNPGHMHSSCGGVTRNVLENLARMGTESKMLTVVGDDVYGHKIIQDSTAAGIDMSNVFVAEGHNSSTYLSILDQSGDMYVALSDMSVMNNMTPAYLRSKMPLINAAQLVVCDPSIPPQIMDLLLDLATVPVYVDPVSTAYAKVVKSNIGRFYMAKPNILEAEVLSDVAITDEKTLDQASRVLIEKGLKQVIISMGSRGCYYRDDQGLVLKCCLRPLEQMENATGAGDAFMAGVIHCRLAGISGMPMLEFASAASAVAIQSADTINQNISVSLIKTTLDKRRK